ncbi:MAG: phosphatase PAP2 family protein [Pseudobutyrivibrio sp.]|nr:phosphatase PAP2 family protein [Pseudobutyrivibrio sp.]
MINELGDIFYFNWELDFLHMLQGIHTPILDKLMVTATNLGENALILLIGFLILAIFPRTRKLGGTLLLATIVSLLIVNVGLKPFITRCRPCWLEPSIKLLVDTPSSYSFPSGHTNGFFAMATAVFLRNKKIGIPCLGIASLVAFSRLYLFVHWPTDILGGMATGIISALIGYVTVEAISKMVGKIKMRVKEKKYENKFEIN